MSASWATSTVCSPAVSSRASVSVAQEPVEVGGIGGSRPQLGERHAPPGVLRALAELGEPDEHRPREPLLVGIEAHVHRLGRPGDRPADAAALLVAGDGQPAVGPSLPGLEEGVRQQRQRPGLTGHVAEHQVDEARLEGQARDPGGLLDRRRSPSSSIGVSSAVDVSSAAANAGTEPLKPKKSARMTKHDEGRPRGAAAAPSSAARTPPRSSASSHSVKHSSNWSTTRTSRSTVESATRPARAAGSDSSRASSAPVDVPSGRGARRGELGKRMRPGGQTTATATARCARGRRGERGQDARSYDRRLAAARGADHREEVLPGEPARAWRRRPRPDRRRSRRPRTGTPAGPCTDTSPPPRRRQRPAAPGIRRSSAPPDATRSITSRTWSGLPAVSPTTVSRSRRRRRRRVPAARPSVADQARDPVERQAPRAMRSTPATSASSSSRRDGTTSIRPRRAVAERGDEPSVRGEASCRSSSTSSIGLAAAARPMKPRPRW